jgi:hypothetical protein
MCFGRVFQSAGSEQEANVMLDSLLRAVEDCDVSCALSWSESAGTE